MWHLQSPLHEISNQVRGWRNRLKVSFYLVRETGTGISTCSSSCFSALSGRILSLTSPASFCCLQKRLIFGNSFSSSSLLFLCRFLLNTLLSIWRLLLLRTHLRGNTLTLLAFWGPGLCFLSSLYRLRQILLLTLNSPFASSF